MWDLCPMRSQYLIVVLKHHLNCAVSIVPSMDTDWSSNTSIRGATSHSGVMLLTLSGCGQQFFRDSLISWSCLHPKRSAFFGLSPGFLCPQLSPFMSFTNSRSVSRV